MRGILAAALLWLGCPSVAVAEPGKPDKGGSDGSSVGFPGMDLARRALSSACGGEIPTEIDRAGFEAQFGKLQLPKGLANEYTRENGMDDVKEHCIQGIRAVAKLCQVEGNGPKLLAAVKAIRCAFGSPQRDFQDGALTFRVDWWASGVGRASTAELATLLGVQPHGDAGECANDEQCGKNQFCKDGVCMHVMNRPKEPTRCSGPSDCDSKEACGRTSGRIRGPRCVTPGSVMCKRTDDGNPFGRADPKCPAGQLCTQYGVCFPKAEFPVRGRNLPSRAPCYLASECRSRVCAGDGQTRFGTSYGSCAP